jgi:hypothetical protein
LIKFCWKATLIKSANGYPKINILDKCPALQKKTLTHPIFWTAEAAVTCKNKPVDEHSQHPTKPLDNFTSWFGRYWHKIVSW